jgi:class 3 adenylate cyclase
MADASVQADSTGLQGEEAPERTATARRITGPRDAGRPQPPVGAQPPVLQYRDDLGVEQCYVLEHDRPMTIGRGEEVDVTLPWDRTVSSAHAEAVKLGEDWVIADAGVSRNGTFVNGERVNGRRRLRDGDTIRVGRTALVFQAAAGGRHSDTTVIEGVSVLKTVTLLFTDVAGSTELMERLGDDAADRVRREHFATLREASRAHDGTVVKNLGDGLMLAFASALGAVACAVAMQQRIAACNEAVGDERMGLRIGVNAGEAICVEGDYFGTPVVVAKRLCDRAQSGQVLVSDVVLTLVGARSGHGFTALGPQSLKGLTDPVDVFELDWTGAPREGAGA